VLTQVRVLKRAKHPSMGELLVGEKVFRLVDGHRRDAPRLELRRQFLGVERAGARGNQCVELAFVGLPALEAGEAWV
jgi:hypothetical protein